MSFELLESNRMIVKNDCTATQLNVKRNLDIVSVLQSSSGLSVQGNITIDKNILTNVGLELGVGLTQSVDEIPTGPYVYVGSSTGNLFFRYNNSVAPVNLTQNKPNNLVGSGPTDVLSLNLDQFESKYIFIENTKSYSLDMSPLEIHINTNITNKQTYKKPPDGITMDIIPTPNTRLSQPYMIVTGTGFTFIDPLQVSQRSPVNFTFNARYTDSWLVDQRILSAYYFSGKDSSVTGSVYDVTKFISLSSLYSEGNTSVKIHSMESNYKGDLLTILMDNGNIVTYTFRESAWIADSAQHSAVTPESSRPTAKQSKDGKWLIVLTSTGLKYYKRRNNSWKEVFEIPLVFSSTLPLFSVSLDASEICILQGNQLILYYRGGDMFHYRSTTTFSKTPVSFSKTHGGEYTLVVFADETCLYKYSYASTATNNVPTLQKIFTITAQQVSHTVYGIIQQNGFILVKKDTSAAATSDTTVELWSMYLDGVAIEIKKIAERTYAEKLDSQGNAVDYKFFLSQRSEFIYVYGDDTTQVLYPVKTNTLKTQLSEVKSHSIQSSAISMSEYNHASYFATASAGIPEIYISGL